MEALSKYSNQMNSLSFKIDGEQIQKHPPIPAIVTSPTIKNGFLLGENRSANNGDMVENLNVPLWNIANYREAGVLKTNILQIYVLIITK